MTVFMFVNVDWFFLSHRLDIAKESAKREVDLTVFADFTSDHAEYAYGHLILIVRCVLLALIQ